MQPEHKNSNGHEAGADPPSQPRPYTEPNSIVPPGLSARRGVQHHTAGDPDIAAAITQSLAQGLCALDLDGHVTYANPAAEQLLGWTEAELLGRPVADFIALSQPEGTRLAPVPVLASGRAGKQAAGDDVLFARRDGTTFPASYVASPLITKGTLRGTALAFSDISERKQREETLRESAEASSTRAHQLEATIEAMTDCVVIFDANGVILHANAADRALFTPRTRTEQYPRTTWERAERMRVRSVDGQLIPPDQWLSKRVLKGETFTSAQSIDVLVRTGDGRDVALSTSGAPVYDTEGRIAGGVIVLRDVTNRRRLEYAVAEHASQLEAIVEAMADGLLVFDLDGRILQVNTAARELLGLDPTLSYTLESVRERGHLLELRDRHGKLLAEAEWPIFDILRGEVLSGETAVDVLARPPGRGDLQISLSGAPMRNSAGEIIGAVLIMHDVTLRRQLEHAVVAHASQLEATFEAMANSVIVYDKDGHIVQVNAAARAFLAQITPAELDDIPLHERPVQFPVFDEHGQPVLDEHRAARRILRGEVLNSAIDQSIGTRDGRRIYVSISGAPIHDESGEIIGAVCIYHDVTARRELEHAVVAHANRLEAMFDAIADSVIVYDKDGHFVQVNAAARAFRAQITATNLSTVSPHERSALLNISDEWGQPISHEHWLQRRILQGEVLTGANTLDIILGTRDGRRIYVSVSGAPIHDESGEIVGAVCIYRDVTARRELESRTQDSLAALISMAEALLQPMMGAKDTAQPYTDAFMQPAMRELATLAHRVLSCERINILTAPSPVDPLRPVAAFCESEEAERLWWAKWDDNYSLSDVLDPELATRVYAGEVVVLNRRDAAVSGQSGVAGAAGAADCLVAPLGIGDEVVGVLETDYGDTEHTYTTSEIALTRAVAQLATMMIERERLLREREEAHANALALREANRRMDDFLSIASHELKTPLTSLKLCVELAERRAERAAAEAEASGKTTAATDAVVPSLMERQVERLERLVSDLLDASSIQADKLQLRVQPANLAAIVREVYLEQRLAHLDRGLVLELADEIVPVLADPDRISQVVMNFLTNALKYSSPGYPVTVRVRRQGDHGVVEVRDHSGGIPAEALPHLFDRFYRVPGVQVQSGSGVGLGLGLYICKTIIERHDGEVGVTSTIGQGSTFWFSLPIIQATSAEESRPADG